MFIHLQKSGLDEHFCPLFDCLYRKTNSLCVSIITILCINVQKFKLFLFVFHFHKHN